MRNQKNDSTGTVSKDGNVTLVLKRDKISIIGGGGSGVGNIFLNILVKHIFSYFFLKLKIHDRTYLGSRDPQGLSVLPSLSL